MPLSDSNCCHCAKQQGNNEAKAGSRNLPAHSVVVAAVKVISVQQRRWCAKRERNNRRCRCAQHHRNNEAAESKERLPAYSSAALKVVRPTRKGLRHGKEETRESSVSVLSREPSFAGCLCMCKEARHRVSREMLKYKNAPTI